MAPITKPVLISGAGVVGLTLAHGLKKVERLVDEMTSCAKMPPCPVSLRPVVQANIPFQIFERDEHVDARGHGWAITIHWALPFLAQLLDDDTLAALEQAQVDPEVGRQDHGNFLFLNLETLESKFRIPPNKRRRVNREKLRKALLHGVKDHVQWGKRLSNVQVLDGHGDGTGTGMDGVGGGGGGRREEGLVHVTFSDGSSADGSMLVGAEGTNSPTRKFLMPDSYATHQLPVRFLGAAVNMTPEQVRPLRDIDPLLFQGCHPATGNFLWISMMETPEVNGTKGTDQERYVVQINISWILKSDHEENNSKKTTQDREETSTTDSELIAEMKRRAQDFHPLLRHAVDSIPETTPVLEIPLQDWPCLEWDNRKGRVTLVGDAAHAMTMYRGEAANHGILDAYNLIQQLTKMHAGERPLSTAMDDYEQEMRDRTGGEQGAVMLSRQACLDAHDFHALNENSAVLRRRAIKG
ncbi:hypothetical protein E4U21_000226 [Claviceps maximensis]|nr:hypothetical protein E4U21_000226 [Claviceps maximensis]